jgi:hypothetical protein
VGCARSNILKGRGVYAANRVPARRVYHIASLLHRVLRARAAPGVVPGAFWGLFRGAPHSRRGNRHNGHEGDWRDPPRVQSKGRPPALCGRLPLEEARLAASRASSPQGTHWPRSRPAELRSTSQAPRHRSKSPPAARPPAPGCHTGREARSRHEFAGNPALAVGRDGVGSRYVRPICSRAARDRVGAKPAGDRVVSTTAVEGVVTGVAEYAIVPAAAVHGVDAGAARYPDVGAVSTVDLVSPDRPRRGRRPLCRRLVSGAARSRTYLRGSHRLFRLEGSSG